MELDDLPVVYRGEVASRFLDQFGHVNVMWYTYLFDEATRAFFDEVGCGPTYYDRAPNAMFALEQHTRYLRELRLDDPIEIRGRALGRSPKRIHFLLFLVNTRTAELAATSELIGMHMDLASRRSAAFPEPVARRIDQLVERHRALAWPAPACGAMSP